MSELVASLDALLDRLLGDTPRETQRDAAAALHALLLAMTDFDAAEPASTREPVLPSGIALSPWSAAECVRDYPRTRAFVLGLAAAIREAQHRFPGRRIEIVYAGCGPFAVLALPITRLFTAAEVGFTMLDVSPRSLEHASRLFAAVGAAGHVTEWVACDATSYRHPAGRAFNVLVTETMRKALSSEPQVAITAALAPQLDAGGILVPERVSIGAHLDDLDAEALAFTDDLTPAPDHGRRAGVQELGTVFELTAALRPPGPTGAYEPVVITVPDGPRRHLVLSTRIRVFGRYALDDYESGLTFPTVLRALDRPSPGTRVELQYVPGMEPRLCARLLP